MKTNREVYTNTFKNKERHGFTFPVAMLASKGWGFGMLNRCSITLAPISLEPATVLSLNRRNCNKSTNSCLLVTLPYIRRITMEFLKVTEAAKLLRLKEKTVRKWVKLGKLKAKRPGRFLLISKSSVTRRLS